MRITIYFRTGESTVFSRITDMEEWDTERPSSEWRIVLKRGAEKVAKFYAGNIAGYSKREDEETVP